MIGKRSAQRSPCASTTNNVRRSRTPLSRSEAAQRSKQCSGWRVREESPSTARSHQRSWGVAETATSCSIHFVPRTVLGLEEVRCEAAHWLVFWTGGVSSMRPPVESEAVELTPPVRRTPTHGTCVLPPCPNARRANHSCTAAGTPNRTSNRTSNRTAETAFLWSFP